MKIFFLLNLLLIVASSSTLHAGEAIIAQRVIDGNTIELSDGRQVRMIGVDAPESGSPDRNAMMASVKKADPETVQLYVFLAKNFIRNLVEGERVWLTFDDAYASIHHRDQAGKVLAYVWFSIHYKDNRNEKDIKKFLGISSEDKLLNAEIIKQGYAFARTERFIYSKEFQALEHRAEEHKKGLWRSEPQSYDEILERGQGARLASTAVYIPPSARKLSLESARRTFTKLIDMNPEDYRAYYERSWLGADLYHDNVSEQNLTDIDNAISLAPKNFILYLQRFYLLRLLEHAEAPKAYERAVQLSKKFQGNGPVSNMTKGAVERGEIPEVTTKEKNEMMTGFMEDAYRGGLNEEHFLFFMARYKEILNTKNQDELQKILENLLQKKSFRLFYEKHRDWIQKAAPHEIIYRTQYSQRGWQDPQEILDLMEKL